MPARQLWVPGAEAMDELAQLVLAMAPAELEQFAAGLDPDDLAVLELAMAQGAALGWRSDPATMAHHLDPTYQLWPYVKLLSTKFREACEGVSTRQIWSVPGRYGKSLMASQWGPVWQLDRRPEARFILVSYGHSLAVENAVGIRDRLRNHAEVLRCQLKADRRRMDRFVTEQGGGVLAAGIMGRVRGFGAGAGGGIVVDDPFKDWQQAHSENSRKLVWNQYRGTLLDRLDDEDAFIIVVHHRVHEDDLTGRLLDDATKGGEQWDQVVLPALAGPDDPLGREPGAPLEPERFSLAFIDGQRRAMGSYLFGALQQQDPTPEEGTELLRAWFSLYETPPASADQRLSSWDLKLKDREAGDYVVGQVWWRTGPDYWLRDQIRGQFDHATTACAIALLAVRHPEVGTHVVEAAGSADEVLPQLRKPMEGYVVDEAMAGRLGMDEAERAAVGALRRRGMSGLVPHPPRGDKRVRARAFIAPAAEAGNVHVPAYGEFTPHLLDELAAFPNATHDDQVDAMSQALARLTKGGASATAPTGRVRSAAPGTRPTTVAHPTAQGATAAIVAPGRRPPRVPRGR